MKQITQEEIKEWFFEPLLGSKFTRKQILNVSKIERLAKMPAKSLQFYLAGEKYKNIHKHVEKLVNVLEIFGFKKK